MEYILNSLLYCSDKYHFRLMISKVINGNLIVVGLDDDQFKSTCGNSKQIEHLENKVDDAFYI